MKTPRLIYPSRVKTIVGIDQFKHYIKLTEQALFEEARNEHISEKDPLLKTIDYRNNFIFPEIHKRSMFITLYSFVEKELIQLAQLYQKTNNPLVKFDDYSGSGIDKVKEFFSKSIGIKIAVNDWSKLICYRGIRNHFAHVPNDYLASNSKYLNSFRQIQTIKLTPYTWDNNTIYDIHVPNEFIYEALDTIENYFNDLYDILESHDNYEYPTP
ncbi:hypothetical protein ACIQYG_20925 [Peribacillus sp. NPDC096622]|uniref:hypothetical protein n=1 Tax=Peribacillus sp. NPDC096622 TaxID=3364396 RepID=UPI00380BE293